MNGLTDSRHISIAESVEDFTKESIVRVWITEPPFHAVDHLMTGSVTGTARGQVIPGGSN